MILVYVWIFSSCWDEADIKNQLVVLWKAADSGLVHHSKVLLGQEHFDLWQTHIRVLFPGRPTAWRRWEDNKTHLGNNRKYFHQTNIYISLTFRYGGQFCFTSVIADVFIASPSFFYCLTFLYVGCALKSVLFIFPDSEPQPSPSSRTSCIQSPQLSMQSMHSLHFILCILMPFPLIEFRYCWYLTRQLSTQTGGKVIGRCHTAAPIEDGLLHCCKRLLGKGPVAKCCSKFC